MSKRIVIVGEALFATSILLALTSAAGAAQCVGSESQGAGMILKAGAKSAEIRIRAEGECPLPFGTFGAVRIDGMTAPGSDGKQKDLTFADLGTLPEVEAYARLRRPIPFAPWLSASVIAGGQRALNGGTIGLGGNGRTLGFGAHAELGGSWLDAYVVDGYAPAGPGARLLAAGSIKLAEHVRYTAIVGAGKTGSFVETSVQVGK